MLPVLFKLEFATLAMKLVFLAIGLALTAYGFWAGWRNADRRANAPYRAAAFAAAAALVSTAASIWAFPPMSESLAQAIKALVYVFGAVLTVTSGLYGRKLAKKGNESSEMLSYGLLGVLGTGAVIYFGFDGPMGRGFGAPLHTYGLMIATAFIVAIWFAAREAPRAFPEKWKVDGKMIEAGPYMRERMLDLGFWILIAALIGSKVLFVIVNWDHYRLNPKDMFSLTGGLVFYGGFIGSVLAAWVYTRIYKIPFLRLADMAIPSVAIGHMFGRIGCLSAGCCWGDIARAGSKIAIRFPSAQHLPFGGYGTSSLAYSDQLKDSRWVDASGQIFDHAVAGAQQISAYAHATGYSMPVYPTQLMEAAGELLLFIALITLRRYYKKFHGQILATWLMGYAVLRTSIELFRGDLARGYLFRVPEVHPVILSTSQLISLGIFAAGVAIWVLYSKNRLPEAKVAAA
jgi:phosphatidylglycerol:prolipoprotein diacylglycerol transferase